MAFHELLDCILSMDQILVNMSQAELYNIISKRNPHIFLKKTAEIFFVQAHFTGCIRKGYLLFIVLFCVGTDSFQSGNAVPAFYGKLFCHRRAEMIDKF